ncbi:hypothetical protein Cni_G06451 [Canna indica]|uniref:Uncharacterized protein n=1 Tax=Canna indica TaxID=4628 RepID=A0AAQ3JX08_9LILI|nr:hypothetical protein Cni_G06451 [Canna indica]
MSASRVEQCPLPKSRALPAVLHLLGTFSSFSAPSQHRDKFKALAQELDSSTPTTKEEIYRQVVGPERHGHTRGYGLGPTSTTVFGTTPGHIELTSQLRIANTQNAELKTKIDDLEKKMDDDRRKMEERMEERMEMERKKVEEKMEEDRRKMQILLAFVEEMKTKK